MDASPRVLTVPNVISTARLGLFVCYLLVLFGAHQRWGALAILAVAGATDFADGFVARRYHQVSQLGKVLDPTVDRLLLAGAIASLVAYGAVPLWLAVVVLSREALVSVGVVGLALAGARRIDVLFIGKAGTFGLMVAFPLLLGGDGAGILAETLRVLAWVIVLPALSLSLAAALAYLPHARKALGARESISLGSQS